MDARTDEGRSDDLRLPPGLAAAGSARRFLSSRLTGWQVDDDVVDVATLLTSELVGNAVRHGEGDVLLTVRARPLSLRVEVHDEGRGLPVLRAADQAAEGGRGLWLVDALAARWGTMGHRDDGKDVWFELDARLG